ncbi:tetratricopeptide repeat protein [Tateyamaria omphalii]|uniref:tetratricopeptide repeat protein n=1 Tax=Tateyamaria omphalii TaxID=299262 RepID=UPI001C98FC48|nr:tetratricopeptide repeat protein [Tateyamaria omphalii]MBY5933800.1 tetratricopeptide repeat protein [Tateyamaria omphalii]
MKSLFLGTLLANLFLFQTALARPILSDSQKSYAAVCLEEDESPDRLIAICETALARASVLNADTRDMQVSLARAYDNDGQPQTAITIVADVLEHDPNHGAALNVLGWAHWGLSDYDAAIDAFERALNTGASAQSFAGLASSGRYMGTIEEDEYVTLIDTALAISPDYLWAHREKAWFYIESGRPNEGEQILKAALQYDDKDPWTLYALGVACTIRVNQVLLLPG